MGQPQCINPPTSPRINTIHHLIISMSTNWGIATQHLTVSNSLKVSSITTFNFLPTLYLYMWLHLTRRAHANYTVCLSWRLLNWIKKYEWWHPLNMLQADCLGLQYHLYLPLHPPPVNEQRQTNTSTREGHDYVPHPHWIMCHAPTRPYATPSSRVCATPLPRFWTGLLYVHTH